jgi:hypothetical protein
MTYKSGVSSAPVPHDLQIDDILVLDGVEYIIYAVTDEVYFSVSRFSTPDSPAASGLLYCKVDRFTHRAPA